MSCHDIGRGLNEITRLAISMYDNNEISMQAAKKIIATAEAAVNWCDGNGDEAIRYFQDCRCGKCLKFIPEGEKMYSVYSLPYSFSYQEEKKIMLEEQIAGGQVCEECLPSITKHLESKEEYSALVECIKEDARTSTGEMSETNNGYRWVRDPDWFDVKTSE